MITPGQALHNWIKLNACLIDWCSSEKPWQGKEFRQLVEEVIGAYLMFLDTQPESRKKEPHHERYLEILQNFLSKER